MVCWFHLSKYRHFLCGKLGHFLKTHQCRTKLNPHLAAVQVTLATTSLQYCAFQWSSRFASTVPLFDYKLASKTSATKQVLAKAILASALIRYGAITTQYANNEEAMLRRET